MSNQEIIRQAMDLATQASVPWTRFMDMHSGGSLKLAWQYVYINAPEPVARHVFEQMFERDPDNITCDCCGEDFSYWQYETFEKAIRYDMENGHSLEAARFVELPEVLRVLRGEP